MSRIPTQKENSLPCSPRTAQKLPDLKGLVLALVGAEGAPDIPLGKTDLVVADRDEKRLWLYGILKDHEGRRVGRVAFDGIEISDLPPPNRGGRPRDDAKQMAICLASAINLEMKNNQKTAADLATARQFGRTGSNKRVPEARSKFMKSLGYHAVERVKKENERIAIFIEKPTFYISGRQCEVLGVGWYWFSKMGGKARRGIFKIRGEAPSVDDAPKLNSSFLLVRA